MKKLLITLLLLIMPAMAGVNINSSADLLGNANIPGHFPMTVGGWAHATTLQSDGDGFISSGAWGGGVGSGWLLHLSDTFNCGTPVIDFVKGAGSDDFICSSITIPTGVWVFVAAVVTSNNVHFFTMSANGTVTEQDVGDTIAFTSSTNLVGMANSTRVSSPVFKFNGILASMFIFATAALTDNELKAEARTGPSLIGHPSTAFWPLYFTNGSQIYPNEITGLLSMGVVSGTPINATHCPCGQHTGEGH